MSKPSKPHVAVLSSPGLGHITPLLELAKRLVSQFDLHVTLLVVTSSIPSAAQDQLLRSPTADKVHVVELPPVDAAALISDDMLVLTQLAVMVEHSLNSSLKSTLLQIGTPQALIIDIFCTQAFDICKPLSIPVYSFFTASVALFTFSLYLPTLDRNVDGEFVDLVNPVAVPGCSPIRTDDLIDQVKNRKNDEYKWYLYHVARLPEAAGIFLNSWAAMEPIPIKSLTEHPFYRGIPVPETFPVGPLIKQVDCTDEDTDTRLLLDWLDDQPPESVLFVALGSGGTFTSAQLTEVAYGLESSQQRFVLVVRFPSDRSASAAFFSVGSEENNPASYLPEGFVERTRGRGFVVASWAPQIDILRHAATGGFLSHCGWNSTLESVSNGVPMIAWPLYAEQRMNATMLEEEVGVAVKAVKAAGAAVVGRGEIERVVRLVMEGEKGKEMREKAKSLKETAAEAVGVGGGSWAALAEVAERWKR